MRLCIRCLSALDGSDWDCNSCGHKPPSLNGFTALAPEFDDAVTGFDAMAFTRLAELEAGSFWFRARNRLIVQALRKYCPRAESFLEVGCGTGFVLAEAGRAFPQMRLTGSELHTSGLSFAKARVGDEVELLQMDARRIPFVDEFDVIGAFDVLEHIEDDQEVLQGVHRALRPQGKLLLSVPQHAFLWSKADEIAYHVRRYSGQDLAAKVRQAGFSIIRSTSFVATLLPFMAVSRWFDRSNPDYDPAAELRLGGMLNSLFERIMDAERLIIMTTGIDLPFGGSRFLIARKE